MTSSGIVVTLLLDGRTAQFGFKLPLNLATIDDPVYQFTKNSGMKEVFRKCQLIIWMNASWRMKKHWKSSTKVFRI